MSNEPTKPAINLDTIKCGYVVGLQPDGSIEFHVMGEDAGLVQLLGLHAYAGKRIEIAFETSQNVGNALLAKGFNGIFKQLETIVDMLSKETKSKLFLP